MSELTDEEIQNITEQLADIRKKLRENGATALNPNPRWNMLRKEVALLNKKLNAHTASKEKARLIALKDNGSG